LISPGFEDAPAIGTNKSIMRRKRLRNLVLLQGDIAENKRQGYKKVIDTNQTRKR
jgi:hypothetical protein